MLFLRVKKVCRFRVMGHISFQEHALRGVASGSGLGTKKCGASVPGGFCRVYCEKNGGKRENTPTPMKAIYTDRQQKVWLTLSASSQARRCRLHCLALSGL